MSDQEMFQSLELRRDRLIHQKSPFIRVSQGFKDFALSLAAQGVLPFFGPSILQVLSQDGARVELVDMQLKMLDIECQMLMGLYSIHNIVGEKVAMP